MHQVMGAWNPFGRDDLNLAVIHSPVLKGCITFISVLGGANPPWTIHIVFYYGYQQSSVFFPCSVSCGALPLPALFGIE